MRKVVWIRCFEILKENMPTCRFIKLLGGKCRFAVDCYTHASGNSPGQVAENDFKVVTGKFFKYMVSDFDFDRMIEYGTESVDQKRTIANPQYKQLTYQIRKSREKKARLEARIFQQMEGNGQTTGVDHLAQTILKSANLIEKIKEYNDEIKVLLAKRKDQPSRMALQK